MNDQIALNLEPEISKAQAEAQRLYNSFVAAIKASGKGYDTSIIKLEHRKTKSGEYNAIIVSGQPLFRFDGKTIVYMYISPRLTDLFQRNNFNLEKIESSLWYRIPAQEVDFTVVPDVATAALEEALRSHGFGCCSRYEACSDAGHCIHPDIMFAAQCAYRENLANGRIFYGKNKNI